MGQFSASMDGVEVGCVLADRKHLPELLVLAADLGEEWLHWVELFAEHEAMAFILIYFDRSGEYSRERPGALLVASPSGLEVGIDLVLFELSGGDCRWTMLLESALRAPLHAYLREHSQAASDLYFWDEQRRLH